MIDYNELINRFDDIPDLPVSEEMLGAYLEGNLNELELSEVCSLIEDDLLINELVNSIQNPDNEMVEYVECSELNYLDTCDLPFVANVKTPDFTCCPPCLEDEAMLVDYGIVSNSDDLIYDKVDSPVGMEDEEITTFNDDYDDDSFNNESDDFLLI